MSADAILSEYDNSSLDFDLFTTKIKGLIDAILAEEKLQVHSVACRTKTKESLAGKIAKEIGKYNSLREITDVSGIRIITYFEDDVDRIAEIIEREFVIDAENSVDKRKTMDPDRFGYTSLHYVVSLSSSRKNLIEYKRFPEFKAEIQVRSILQHAWAEIEHDLGYKSKEAVPKQIRRRFSRAAGLLELVDNEFVTIRAELRDYAEKIEEGIKTDPKSVEIDKDSISAFIKESPTVAAIKQDIIDLIDQNKEPITEHQLLFILGSCSQFGILTIDDLESAMLSQKNDLVRFFKAITREKGFFPNLGITVVYMFYVMSLKKDGAHLNELLLTFDFIPERIRNSIEDVASKAWNTVKNQKKS